MGTAATTTGTTAGTSVTGPVPVANEYLEEYRAAMARSDGSYDDAAYRARRDLAARYAWAIPDAAAIATLCALGPIIEIGAGSGYWASLVHAAGGDIVAYDIAPPETGANYYGHHHGWFPVAEGGPERAADHHDRALLLCWPPYNRGFALECLEAYAGDTLAYVGEGPGGCTADDAFHDRLERDWERTATVRIPTWPAIHDVLEVWRRR